jgi:hypothetical protein
LWTIREHAFPRHGQTKPEQLEIARFKRETIKREAERDTLKKPGPASRRNRRDAAGIDTNVSIGITKQAAPSGKCK